MYTYTHTSLLRDNWLVGARFRCLRASRSAILSPAVWLARLPVTSSDYYLPVNRLDLHLQLVFHSVHLHVSSLQQVSAGRCEPGTHQSFHLPQTSCSHWFLQETDQTRHARHAHAHAAPRSASQSRSRSRAVNGLSRATPNQRN